MGSAVTSGAWTVYSTEPEGERKRACVDNKERAERLLTLAEEVADERDADVVFYNGEITWNWTPGENFIDMCEGSKSRSSAMLILVTQGGDPDAAYRIARCLQHKYEKFTVFVPGYCKSAGTLLAIGAHEIVMSDHGELGPLDIQLSKPDELFEAGSGLDSIQALSYLKDAAFKMFEDNATELKYDLRGQVTFKTAMQLASELTTGLFKPVYEQIEPTRLGEIARQMTIAEDYGHRLSETSGNLKNGALVKLLNDYPAHSFVIDREEAKELFVNAKEPTEQEQELADLLMLRGRLPSARQRSVMFLSGPAEEEKEEHEHEDERGDDEGEGEGTGTAAEEAGGEPVSVESENGQRDEAANRQSEPS